MRDPKRIERILAKFKEQWEQNPDLRLGQFLTILNAHVSSSPLNEHALFYMEDKEFEKALDSRGGEA